MSSQIFASIPSPSSTGFELGPLTIRYYGVMIAIGVLLLIWLSIRRLVAKGFNSDDCITMAWIGVPSGLIGARIYHLITDWDEYSGRVGDIYKINEGGLGIPGAVIGVAIGVLLTAHFKKLDKTQLVDVVVPFVPVAQAIGRLGNWFNQELYGKPTDLPWAVEIDAVNRNPEYINDTTFHPFFLYEGLWSLVLMGILLFLEKRGIAKRGQMIAYYVLGYTSARVGLEFLRVDFANEFLGLRINVWVMSGFWLIALGYLLYNIKYRQNDPLYNVSKVKSSIKNGDIKDDAIKDDAKSAT